MRSVAASFCGGGSLPFSDILIICVTKLSIDREIFKCNNNDIPYSRQTYRRVWEAYYGYIGAYRFCRYIPVDYMAADRVCFEYCGHCCGIIQGLRIVWSYFYTELYVKNGRVYPARFLWKMEKKSDVSGLKLVI